MNVEQKTPAGYHREMEKEALANLRRDNLRKWMRERSLSQTELADKIESGRAYVSNLFREDRYFGEKAARRIEHMLRMPPGYLDSTGPASMAVADWSHPEELDPETFALVPRVRVDLSAGAGMVVTLEDQMPPLAFRRDWLQKKLVTAKRNLKICNVSGESMHPHLEDGDIVMIDTGQRDVKDGEVYAIRYGDEIRIKRLFKTLEGIRIHSDNPAFPDEVVDPKSTGFEIIGRKIWRGG